MTDQEKMNILNDHEMSSEEMKTVSGGIKIDQPADCKATVEDGSDCWGTDACYGLNQQYWRDKSKFGCSATVKDDIGWCSTNDKCKFNQIRYDECARDFADMSVADD